MYIFNTVLKVYEYNLNELVKDIKYFQIHDVNKKNADKHITAIVAKITANNNYKDTINDSNINKYNNIY